MFLLSDQTCKSHLVRCRLSSNLEFLFFQTVFEEIQVWHTFAIDIPIFDHCKGTFAIHGLSSEELQILEFTENVLADLVYVGFENINLIGMIFLQLGNDPKS